MAKSARPGGKGKETHYNRPAKGAAPARGGRPRKDAEERPSYRKDDRKEGADGRGFAPKRRTDDRFTDKRASGYQRDESRPQRGSRPEDGERPQRRNPASGRGEEYPKAKRFDRDDRGQSGERGRYERKDRGHAGEGRSFSPKRGTDGRFERNDRSPDERPFRPSQRGDRNNAPRTDRGERNYGDKGAFPKRRQDGEDRYPEKPRFRSDRGEGGPHKRDDERRGREDSGRKSYGKRDAGAAKPRGRKPVFNDDEFRAASNPAKPGKWDSEAKNGPMTLNKYLAHSGISSRRDAADIIKEGKVEVNGKVLTEPGYRVQPGDTVMLDGKELKPQRHHVYVLLNKPKDFITTTEDDRGRRTVMELVGGATEDRLYPIGRLDRNTTGVLLLTNDGDLAQKLSHPKYECKKIYQVSLDKDLTKRDFEKIIEGVTLEDGVAIVDRLAFLDKKSEIGLEIHSGRNRIVRRIFESLGYDVVKLDRVMYAGLTKKNVSRGKWRLLTEREVIQLKHFRS